MTEERAKRKLSAILSADVKGYSRLMEDNEEATIQTLNTYRNSMSTLIQQHRGRVVDTTGDNLMAEFSSVVDAVKCAVETQKEMSERNAELTEKRRMLFRIGVNLGDIVEEEDRIYGEGVNIAARVESLADAGGICISGTAYDQIGKKLSLGYEYLGEQTVKNIEKPVRVYRVLMEPEAVGKVIRLCLSLKVIPVFIPQGEPWRNGIIEHFNNTMQNAHLQTEYANLDELRNACCFPLKIDPFFSAKLTHLHTVNNANIIS